VERSEIVKGFEAEKDTYVIVQEEEIKKIAPQSQETMEIMEFVKLDEVDPIFFDTSYYAVPEEPGRRAYQLLLQTMQKTGYAAMAKLAMHQREYTVVIRPRAEGLTLHSIYYPEEVRAIPEYGQVLNAEVKPQEIQLAEQLVESLASPFQPEKYEDTYQKKLLELIEAKREGKVVAETQGKKLAPVIDLMTALQKSLGQVERKPAARTAEADTERATEERPARKPRRVAGR
jgi:DNA end-binding protein Ku